MVTLRTTKCMVPSMDRVRRPRNRPSGHHNFHEVKVSGRETLFNMLGLLTRGKSNRLETRRRVRT